MTVYLSGACGSSAGSQCCVLLWFPLAHTCGPRPRYLGVKVGQEGPGGQFSSGHPLSTQSHEFSRQHRAPQLL